MIMARYFKVVNGTHVDETGKTYRKGDVVKSEGDLAETFVNKFEELKGEEAQRFAEEDKRPVEKLERVKAQRRGGFRPNEGTTEDKSDKPVDTRKLMDEAEEEKPEGEASEQEEEPTQEEPEVEEEEPEEEDREDVTSQFDNATDGGLKVFKTPRGYLVCDEDELEAPLNAEPFRNKGQVAKFVDKNVKR